MSAARQAPPRGKWSWSGTSVPKTRWCHFFGLLAVAAAATGCAGDDPLPKASSTPGATPLDPADLCKTPNEGCPCDSVEVVDCGQVVEQHDDYVTCSVGHRSCDAGTWGACIGERQTQARAAGRPPAGGSYRIQALGTAAECPPGFDPCDPYCNITTDTAEDLPLPPGLTETPDGITLVETGAPNCTALTLVPSTTRLTVTAFSPLTVTPAGPVTFTLTASPPGCSFPPFTANWVVDKTDRAVVTGTTSANGELQLAEPLAGPLRVTAYGMGLSAYTDIEVKVNVVEARDNVEPNEQTSSFTAYNSFGAWNAPNAGSTAAGVTWLYPYADTYFPLGLPAPHVQYWYTNSTSGDGADLAPLASRNVKVSLRYPANSSSNPSAGNYSDFNYSLIVRESNVVSKQAGKSEDSRDPQVIIPEAAWRYFERTARGSNADLVVQRRRLNVVENESRRRIHFVDGQLKGTVYYNSYSSPQGGNTGAILAIQPGATAPQLAVQPSGKCTVCHSVNSSGSQIIVNGYRADGSDFFNQSRRYNLTNTAAFPAPTVLQSYDREFGSDNDPRGNRYTFGGPLGSGGLYMTHGACPPGTSGACASGTAGERNWRAPAAYSRLFSVADNINPLAVTGWPNDVLAVSPRFSPDGTKLAFGFWGGSNIDGLAPVTGGTRLAAVDFTCATPPCTSASTGFSVSNGRDLTPSVAAGANATTGTHKVAWPTFSPGGGTVVYQRQFRTSKTGAYTAVQTGSGPAVTITGTSTTVGNGLVTITTAGARGTAQFSWSYGAASGTNVLTAATVALGATGLTVNFPSTANYALGTTYTWTWAALGSLTNGWSPSEVNSVSGALAELWASNVPTAGSGTPTRLLALNGLSSAGTPYLPEDARTFAPFGTAFHSNAGASFTIYQGDNCGNTGTATNVVGHRLNYLPSMAPTDAGGLSWVVFTSRRMYGSVAHGTPWEPKATETCYSGGPSTKKLWVAAVDSSWTPGTDPSHPAFYLPGQELTAGNSNAYWVNSSCAAVGASCSSHDDCCGGTGAAATTQCRVVSAATFPPTRQCENKSSCSAAGEECITATDCCTGLSCPTGGGLCLQVPALIFEPQSLVRDYIAECPKGTLPEWRFLEWQAALPAGTSIDFSVQTKAQSADPYLPATPLLLNTATTSTSTVVPNTWDRGPNTVHDTLESATPALSSRAYLRVTIRLNPDGNGDFAPTLKAWRQVFDCVPGE
jgi:hypothetical protein